MYFGTSTVILASDGSYTVAISRGRRMSMDNRAFGTLPDGREQDRMTIKTGKNTYRFTSDWTDNACLNSILAGLVADDLMECRQDENS